MAVALDVEKGLSYLGSWSKWHIVMYLLSGTIFIFAAIHMMAIVFIGMEPETIHCKVPEGVSPSEAIPPDPDNSEVLDRCSHYLNFSRTTNVTVSGCPMGWHYSDEVYSIIHEMIWSRALLAIHCPWHFVALQWDTVCNDAWKVSTSQTIMVVGVMFGAVFMANMADRVGRKRIMLGSVLGISALGFCVAWVKHYWLFCVIRFIIGFVHQGVVLAGFIYSCELFPMADRTLAALFVQMSWMIGMFLLDFFAYFVRRWGHLMISISVPGVLIIPLFWILPESLPFLAAHGRNREAKEILQNAAKMNKVTLPPEFELSLEDEEMLDTGVSDFQEPPPGAGDRRSSSIAVVMYAARHSSVGQAMRRMSRPALPPDGEIHNYTTRDLVKSKRLFTFSLIAAFLWCTGGLVYYGLSLNSGSLAGDPYLNFFLYALVECPAILIAAALLQLVGRRVPIFSFYLIAGVPLIVTAFIPETTDDGTNLKPLIVALSMIGKFGISAGFGSVFLYAPELFPTTIRGAGLGIASIGARIGNIIAPFTPLVVALVYWLPSTVFGVMCIISAILVLILPETLGRPLPQTIREVERWSRTLTPEEKEKFKALKKAERARQKEMKLVALTEENEEEEHDEL